MPRLIDDLRAPMGCLSMPHFVVKEKVWGESVKVVNRMLQDPGLPVLLIDNVADYYYQSDQEYWDLRTDFPNLAPPYQTFWAESRLVTKIHSKEKGDTDITGLISKGRIGVLIHAADPKDVKGEGIPENARWILWCELFLDYNQRGITAVGPHGSTFLCVDAQGAIIGTPWMTSLASDADAEIMRGYITFFNPTFLAMSFLHCKNVTVVENEVPKPLVKKYQARTGTRPTKYKTLIIEPLKQILRHAGHAHGAGGSLQKALHICRGHFRDYREGRGLFGKYHQLVWTPSIVRGSKGAKAPAREIEVKL